LIGKDLLKSIKLEIQKKNWTDFVAISIKCFLNFFNVLNAKLINFAKVFGKKSNFFYHTTKKKTFPNNKTKF
jgi:hypothetical protein